MNFVFGALAGLLAASVWPQAAVWVNEQVKTLYVRLRELI